jgi:hypothetical protein
VKFWRAFLAAFSVFLAALAAISATAARRRAREFGDDLEIEEQIRTGTRDAKTRALKAKQELAIAAAAEKRAKALIEKGATTDETLEQVVSDWNARADRDRLRDGAAGEG